MLDLLCRAGVDVVAAHLHHGQRLEADAELEACRQFAEGLNVPFVSGVADVPRLSRDLKMSLEEAGRKARYQFFKEAKATTGCQWIATAHTRDDQAETILLNAVRGSGLAGLAGIPRRRDDIVRPLLDFRREQTRQYCRERDLWFHDDPSNEDLELTRARIRHRVFPELERVNPSFREALVRLGEIASEEEALLNGIAAAALEKSERHLNGTLRFLTMDCEVAFDKGALWSHPRAVITRGLRLATGVMGGHLDHAQTAGLFESLKTAKGAWTLPLGRVVVEWEGSLIHLRELLPAVPYRSSLEVPGMTESEEFGWRLRVVEAEVRDFRRQPGSLDVVIDAVSVKGQLYVRASQVGEGIRPLGLAGTKKISDLFQQSGLTLAARKRLPVVCDLIGPVWVPGICIAERVKITDNSTKGLRMSLEPLSGPPGVEP